MKIARTILTMLFAASSILTGCAQTETERMRAELESLKKEVHGLSSENSFLQEQIQRAKEQAKSNKQSNHASKTNPVKTSSSSDGELATGKVWQFGDTTSYRNVSDLPVDYQSVTIKEGESGWYIQGEIVNRSDKPIDVSINFDTYRAGRLAEYTTARSHNIPAGKSRVVKTVESFTPFDGFALRKITVNQR